MSHKNSDPKLTKAAGESQKSNLALLKMLQEESKSSTLPHKSKNKVEASSPRNSKSEENLEAPITNNIFADYTTLNIRSNRTQNDPKAKVTDDLTTALRLKLDLKKINNPTEATTLFSSGDTLDESNSPVGATYQSTSSSEQLECCVDDNYDSDMMPPLPSPSGVITDAQGLIVPKKLTNPCLIDPDRQSLHRELMFNQKVGRSVLNQKTELQKALEKQKERQFAQQLQQQQQHQKSTENSLGGELERVIMQRAQRMENMKNPPPQDDIDHVNPEYLSARQRLRHTVDTK